MTLNRRSFTTLAGATGLAALSGRLNAKPPEGTGRALPVIALSGQAFGTRWRVLLPAGRHVHGFKQQIDGVLAEIDRQMSPWRVDSDISRFNRAPVGQHGLAPETMQVTRAALHIAELSDGAFDPTVGPLVARWGFGPITGDGHPDWTALEPSASALTKTQAGCTLDLCGIAKGFALDRISALLLGAGQGDFLIDIGGELSASGQHPEGRSWRSGIEDPRRDMQSLVCVITLRDQAVATSGTRWNAVRLGDRSASHIINPSARQPVDDALASVTVIAPSAMMADGWATALMAAGAQRGPDIARQHGIVALFLTHDGGALTQISTGGFDAYILA